MSRLTQAGPAAIAALAGLVLASMIALLAPALARATLLTSDNTPFPPSTVIVGANWTSPRYSPPSNQWGDLLPTIWADDGDQYTIMDDGGTGTRAGALWKQSVAQITGTPPRIHFSHVGNPSRPAPYTYAQIKRNRSLWSGPLGPYYSSGLVEANEVFYATQENNWSWGTNGLFAGLAGIAYSTDHGQTWTSGAKAFPAPLGNLSWVVRGEGGQYADGWVYAIATEREFNARWLIMGRSRPQVAKMTNPSAWQWVSGFKRRHGLPWPEYSSSLPKAAAIASWRSHITYPQMAYDAPLRHYLLTFTYSYGATPPSIWRSGSELVILVAPHPWGPFSFVAREPYFGPSNGYDAGFPVRWISGDGATLWLKWAANFDGCSTHLDCAGGYGFNYRQLRFTVAQGTGGTGGSPEAPR
ncbi:MAG: hypothetical protein ACR2MK_01485 [Solirubrobacteraceae bacterium]